MNASPPTPLRRALILAAAAGWGPFASAHAQIAPAPLDADGRPLIERIDAAAGQRPAEHDEGFFGPRRGLVEFTLSGAGEAEADFESSGANFTFDANYYLRRNWSLGARQSLGTVERNNDSEMTGSTSLFTQVHFGRGQLRPFVGGGVGFIYGEGVSETVFGGPEAGARFYIRDNTFLYSRGSYDLLLDGEDGRFDNGRLVYSVGVGFSF